MKKKMATKALVSSRESSKEKRPKVHSAEEEGEESDERQLDSVASGKGKVVFSSEAAQNEDGNPTMANFGGEIVSKSAHPSVFKPVPRTTKSSSKGGAHDDEGQSERPSRDSKKPRTGKGAESPGGRTTRQWSFKDEVRVLKGMIAFRDASGQNPSDDMAAFNDFVKKKLQVEISRAQVKEKMESLKKRFWSTINKRKNGEDPQEDKVFKLSKKIFGDHAGNASKDSKNGNENGVKSGKKVEPVVKQNGINDEDGVDERNDESEEEEDDEEEEQDGGDGEKEEQGKEDGDKEFGSKYPYLMESFNIVNNAVPSLVMSEYGKSYMMKSLSVISNDKAKELNEKWKQMAVKEMELNVEKLNLMKEQIELFSRV